MKPHTSYIICATPRSGSSLLCDTLKNTFIAGRPSEFFHRDAQVEWSKRWGVSSYAAYLDKVIETGTTPNGIFGVKMFWQHFFPVSELVSTACPNLHYIWLTRREKVRQAISQYKALQTGVWHWKGRDRPVADKQPEFSFEHIDALYYRILAHEVAWQKHFAAHDVTPFMVVYEDFVDKIERTTMEILRYLKIPIPNGHRIGQRKRKKIADELNEEWLEKYNHIKGR